MPGQAASWAPPIQQKAVQVGLPVTYTRAERRTQAPRRMNAEVPLTNAIHVRVVQLHPLVPGTKATGQSDHQAPAEYKKGPQEGDEYGQKNRNNGRGEKPREKCAHQQQKQN